MWVRKFYYDCECYDFVLDNKSIAYIEVGVDFSQCTLFFGFVLTKNNVHFHMEGKNLDSLMFKMILKLKEFGWEVDGFPLAVDN